MWVFGEEEGFLGWGTACAKAPGVALGLACRRNIKEALVAGAEAADGGGRAGRGPSGELGL